jgi:hypothetical protein
MLKIRMLFFLIAKDVARPIEILVQNQVTRLMMLLKHFFLE